MVFQRSAGISANQFRQRQQNDARDCAHRLILFRSNRNIKMQMTGKFHVLIFGALALATIGLVRAQELQQGEKSQPTDKEVAELIGGPLAKVFAKFGAPVDLFVSDSE